MDRTERGREPGAEGRATPGPPVTSRLPGSRRERPRGEQDGELSGGHLGATEQEPGPDGTRGKLRQARRPLTFEDHHARLGTDPLDPGCPAQVVAVGVVAGPALVGARVLRSELVDGHAAGRVPVVGGVDVDAVQPSAVPELGTGVIGTAPFKPPLDLGDRAAHGLAVQLHAAPRPPLLGQWRLDEAGYRGRVGAAITREERREGKGQCWPDVHGPRRRAGWGALQRALLPSSLWGGTGRARWGSRAPEAPEPRGLSMVRARPGQVLAGDSTSAGSRTASNQTRAREARG